MENAIHKQLQKCFDRQGSRGRWFIWMKNIMYTKQCLILSSLSLVIDLHQHSWWSFLMIGEFLKEKKGWPPICLHTNGQPETVACLYQSPGGNSCFIEVECRLMFSDGIKSSLWYQLYGPCGALSVVCSILDPRSIVIAPVSPLVCLLVSPLVSSSLKISETAH